MQAAQYETGAAASTYRDQEILSEGPVARVARVYDMAGLEVARIRAALRSGNPAAKGLAVTRAARWIALLQSSLDLDQGGEVARNLDRLYAYLLSRLSQAHARDDDGVFREIAGHLGELGSAWREVASRGRARNAADGPAAASPSPR